MKIDVTFSENAQAFRADFGEVQEATDGGYERGYDAGYEKGYADCKASSITIDGIATGAQPSGDIVVEVEEIGEGAFAYRKAIEGVFLPNAKTIGNHAFNTSPIDSITMPKIETIKNNVFYMSRGSMISITLPATLKTIGTMAFGYTTLKTVTFEGKPESIATNAFIGSNQITDIFVPWSEGEVPGAPWGAPTKATIHYNSIV